MIRQFYANETIERKLKAYGSKSTDSIIVFISAKKQGLQLKINEAITTTFELGSYTDGITIVFNETNVAERLNL